MSMNKKVKSNILKYGKKTTPFLISASIVLSMSACSFLPKEEAVLAPPLQQPATVNYDTDTVKKGTIERKVTCIGSFVSVSQSDMYFKYRGGRLKSINVRTGDKVKPGDVIAELDTDNLESDIRQQELAVKKAQINYDRLKSDMDNDKEPTDVTIAKLQLNDLQRQYDKIDAALPTLAPGMRIQDLFPGVDVDNLKSQIEQKKLSIMKSVESYQRDLDNAGLSVETEKLKLQDLNLELQKSKLISDIVGVVVYVDGKINQGDTIAAYKLLARVADPTQIQLQYSDATKTSDFRLGMKVDVKVASKMYQGEVVMTPANAPPEADETTKKSIRIQVADLPPTVEIGNSGDISLTLEKRENVLIVPRNAVKFFSGKKYLQILEDGVKKERDVETGIETVTDVEIIRGVKEGDKIIIR